MSAQGLDNGDHCVNGDRVAAQSGGLGSGGSFLAVIDRGGKEY